MISLVFNFDPKPVIAFGFISFAVLKVSTGRVSDVDWLVFLFAGLFVLRYAFLV